MIDKSGDFFSIKGWTTHSRSHDHLGKQMPLMGATDSLS